MKFEVQYLAIDRDDNVNHRDEVIEAKDSKEVYSKIRKANKGCLLRDVRIRHSNKDADYEESPAEERKCDKCGKLLNDMGDCPVCVHGDEDAREGHSIFEGNKVLKEAKDAAAIMYQADKDKKDGVQLDPLNPDDIEAVADEHGYDDEETAIYKKHYFGEGASTVSVDKFWGLVCSGRDDEIFKICSDDRDPKQYYNRFGSDHSYIMGAIRNGNYSTAKILMTFGHKILEHESYEVVAELLKAKGIK